MSVSSEDVGDDDVFGQEAKDKMPAGNSVAEKNISDAAIRAMFAKKAAKTIHGSLKQKLKSSVEIQIRKLQDFILKMYNYRSCDLCSKGW